NRAKTLLTVSAFICTLAQLSVVSWIGPPSEILAWAGIACFGLANLVFWWALAAHGTMRPAFAFLDAKPSSFTRRGPYRVLRDPVYSAYLLGWVAGAVMTGEPWLLVTVAWMGTLYYIAARNEERDFAQTQYGTDYAAYRRRTGMFLPRLYTMKESF